MGVPLKLFPVMSIVQNRKAFHDYFVEERIEAGIALEGWEVKAIRAGRVQIKEAYVIVNNGEIFLIGCHISPLPTASTHFTPDPVRTRKLLLHAREISRLIGSVERAGYAGFHEAEIFSKLDWWQRDPDEVLSICKDRHARMT